MLSKNEIDYAFKQPWQKNWYGDDPTLDFQGGVFTGYNWNDARINCLRSTLHELVPDTYDVATTYHDDGQYKVFKTWDEDVNYVFITYREYGVKDNNRIWHIEWYKNQGRADKINLNGSPITVEELKSLIYALNNINQ